MLFFNNKNQPLLVCLQGVIYSMLLTALVPAMAGVSEKSGSGRNAVPAEKETAQGYFDRGLQYYYEGKYEPAVNELEQALRIEPNHIEANYMLGYLLHKQKKYAAALERFNKIIQLKPNRKDIYVSRAITYSAMRRFDESLQDFALELSKNPKNHRIYLNRGNVYTMKRQFDLAMEDYNKALKLKPDYAKAFRARGKIYHHQKKYEQALLELNAALDSDPGYARAYTTRGNIHNKMDKYQLALDDHQNAVALATNDYLPPNDLAWFLATVKDKQYQNGKRAIELATQACELTDYKNPGVIDTLAAAYARAGRFDKAVDWQLKAIKESKPGDSKLEGKKRRLELYVNRQAYTE
ncbi:MAG: tetratricopeptide repeat protein [Gammaproteobacteria bacterium]|nr:tetratricopeptide repeat protein [Gammaproteobacteria bacterium]MDH5653158.1 tetratricopeptide repeat protein [Gammaproteobacteria bacterium]